MHDIFDDYTGPDPDGSIMGSHWYRYVHPFDIEDLHELLQHRSIHLGDHAVREAIDELYHIADTVNPW
jgi:hypothetical protein